MHLLAIFIPQIIVLFANFFVMGLTPIDSANGHSLAYWITWSLMAAYARPIFPFIHGLTTPYWPFIPITEINGAFLALTGWKVDKVGDIANLGIVFFVLTILAASWWGGRLSARAGIPMIVLVVISFLIALSPVVHWVWSAHAYLQVLMLPVGIAIYLLATQPHAPSRDEMAVFPVLGFSLSVHYGAAIPIMALILAIMTGIGGRSGGSVYEKLGRLTPKPALILVVGVLTPILLNSLIFAYFRDLLPAVAGMFREARGGNILELGAVVGVFGITVILVFGFVVFVIPHFTLGRVLLSSGGWMLVGWGVGANIHIFYSWAMGFITTISQREHAVTNILEGIRTSNWGLVAPLLFAGGLILCGVSFFRSENTSRDRFFGVFLITLVLFQALGLPYISEFDDPVISAGSVASARYLAPLVAGIPIALLGFRSVSVRNIRDSAVLAGTPVILAAMITVASWAQHVRVIKPAMAVENAIFREMDALIDGYIRDNPDASVFCTSFSGAHCFLARSLNMFEMYLSVSLTNPPMPSELRHPNIRAASYLSNEACDTRACIASQFDRPPRKVLFISPRDPVKEVNIDGRPMSISPLVSEHLVVREIEF